ncbi:MAG: ATP-dependent DNA helicase DinG [Gorillibacterium sp.]|nr:ATP-dependent DNA helicase DinG [Gorillibacterium sp.]
MKFAVLDFETTGGQPVDSIIQVGLVVIENNQIVERYASFVKPDQLIPPFITTLTGINDAMVEDAPALEQVIMEMQRYLIDSVIVAHNAGFDVGFLQRALEACGYFKFNGMVLDTMDILRIAYPTLPSLALGNVCESLGIELERAHQADADAEATAEIWLRSLERFQSLPMLTASRIYSIFQEDPSDFGWFIREQCKLRESTFANPPDHHQYYRQFALNIPDWGEEIFERDAKEVKARLGVPFAEFYEGIKQTLQDKFAVYEEREAQDQMTIAVAGAFLDNVHLMVEAGTGTGKSLGYLLPALYYGIREEQKVLISTHTINLQEQLRQRDFPLLHEIFPIPFRAALIKGRSHYLCLRKFEEKLTYAEYDSSKDELVTAAQMVVWLSDTEQGEDEELHFTSRGGDFWRSVSSDADSCQNRSCPWFKKCFYHRARHTAGEADVVITNHSLLFTDIKAEHRILPGYKNLVIDEAHNFEEVASKHLGTEVSWYSFTSVLMWLYKDSKLGQLPLLRGRLMHESGVSIDKSTVWCEAIDGLYELFLLIRDRWDELCVKLYERLYAASGEFTESQYVLRISDDRRPHDWEVLSLIEDELYDQVSTIIKKVDRIILELKDEPELAELQSLATNIGGSIKELARHRDALRFFMKQTDADYVYWMEGTSLHKAKSLQLMAVPIDVSQMLKHHFFDAKDSIVLTSATLSVGKSFDYIIDQLGLNEAAQESKLRTIQLASPFNYRQQALLVIPRDFPGLRSGKGDGEDVFISALVDSLADVARATRGRMLVLFTSYRMLKQVHSALRERLMPSGIQVMGQGIDGGSRSKLIRLFQGNGDSVLLGTSSFWEGVDIPGDALSCLAIVRLPFQPPNHPVVEAKCDRIKRNNQNPFMKLSVPQAVIRFKQGFGRLVRTASDKGIVIVYDTRVIDSYYGKHFLYSLPGPKIEHMNIKQLVPRITEWMEGE